MGKLFGTDGVRGLANRELTPELAFDLGRAAAHVVAHGKDGKVLIGKDTRASGDLLELAMSAGFMSMGFNVELLGVVPTPAVAYLTRTTDVALGVVISASHNPGEYNGIKIFSENGYKLPDSVEEEIEKIILNKETIEHRPIREEVGRVYINETGQKAYMDHLKNSTPLDLNGIKVALDCGHGALYKIAPLVLEELGAEVFAINTSPNGMNINDSCGSTKPELIQKLVLEKNADIGFAFDGDGDRIIACDEKGNIVDGDHILAICGKRMKSKNILLKDTIVGTVMTNIGLDVFAKNNSLKIVKTAVGDRYILEKMIKEGYNLGGEQSGHIIFLDDNTTGDGLATGLRLLEAYKEASTVFSNLNGMMTSYPQVLLNAKVANIRKYNYLDNEEIKNEIKRIENLLKEQGRVLIRPSGTEPLVRVMLEGKDIEDITKHAKHLVGFIEKRIGEN